MGVGLVAVVPCGIGTTCSWALLLFGVALGCKFAMHSISVRVMVLLATWWCCDGCHGGIICGQFVRTWPWVQTESATVVSTSS
eukprot:9082927-Karenia_brevis.AAC.1